MKLDFGEFQSLHTNSRYFITKLRSFLSFLESWFDLPTLPRRAVIGRDGPFFFKTGVK